MEQPYDESKTVGKPMLDECQFGNAAQTRRFHKCYMELSMARREMFEFQYKNKDFLHGDQ
jgi:hypothetical protein